MRVGLCPGSFGGGRAALFFGHGGIEGSVDPWMISGYERFETREWTGPLKVLIAAYQVFRPCRGSEPGFGGIRTSALAAIGVDVHVNHQRGVSR